MNKFVKLTICAIVALLAVGAISSVQGHEIRAPKPEAVNLVARTKGLPPLVARQYPAPSSPDATPSATPSTTPDASTIPAKSAKTSSPAVPTDLIPSAATPPGAVDTGAKTTPSPSGASDTPSTAPTGTGSLIPQWSSLVGSGSVPSGQPSAAPPLTGTSAKATSTPTSAANKIENGLMGVIIAGIVSSFF